MEGQGRTKGGPHPSPERRGLDNLTCEMGCERHVQHGMWGFSRWHALQVVALAERSACLQPEKIGVGAGGCARGESEQVRGMFAGWRGR